VTKYESRYGSAEPTFVSRAFYQFVRALIVGAAKLLVRMEVDGRANIPAEGAFILAPGAHRSNIDTFVVSVVTRRRMRFMGKDSLWKHAASDWFFSSLGGYPVNRAAADREALNQTLAIVEAGEPVVMFPEGTRRTGPTIDAEDLRDGVAYVASRAQIPIVPVGIGGAERVMPPKARYLRPSKMVMIVGEPIAPPPLKESGRVSRGAVRDMTEELRTTLQALFDESQRRAGARTT
jgi:1-acyl-sn-glycerol-3-phosphate acyltransferase